MEILQESQEEEDDWIMCTPPKGIPCTQYTLTNLQEIDYKIRVAAINAEGVGEVLELEEPVRPKDVLIPPEIEVDSEVGQFVSVKAGSSFRLLGRLSGRPAPEAKWERENGIVNEMAQIETSVTASQLLVNNCSRDDSGR